MKNLPPAGIALLVILLALVGISYGAKNHPRKHHFANGDNIDFFVNNVGPYSNPTETYEYYSLPFCKPTNHLKDGKLIKKRLRMGEVIQGDRAVLSDYEIPFRGIYNVVFLLCDCCVFDIIQIQLSNSYIGCLISFFSGLEGEEDTMHA